jgi:hypothetical protein
MGRRPLLRTTLHFVSLAVIARPLRPSVEPVSYAPAHPFDHLDASFAPNSGELVRFILLLVVSDIAVVHLIFLSLWKRITRRAPPSPDGERKRRHARWDTHNRRA